MPNGLQKQLPAGAEKQSTSVLLQGHAALYWIRGQLLIDTAKRIHTQYLPMFEWLLVLVLVKTSLCEQHKGII